MICFITDVWEGEPDILQSAQGDPLQVFGLDGDLIDTIPAPDAGWTHEGLTSQAERLTPKTRNGADAYLGSQWVGGTEV